MSAEMIVLLFLCGVGAGFINATAGGGSALTLPVLLMTGLDATVANGTNRIAVGVQAMAAVATFHRNGVQPWKTTTPTAGWVLFGAFAGAVAAVRMPVVALEWVFGILFLILAVLIAANKSWLSATEDNSVYPAKIKYPALMVVGVYGGFLQAGVGIPLLLVLVNLVGLEPVRANASKSAIILLYSACILLVFHQAQQVDWMMGGVLGAGGIIGSMMGARVVMTRGTGFVRVFVVVVLVLAGTRSLITQIPA